jgi:2-C-methyl-D-erythritol 4-phosphate cytidylyltransferase
VTAHAVAIVLAAGSGERLGGSRPKALLPLGETPMLVLAVRAALASRSVNSVVVAVPSSSRDLAHAMIEPLGPHAVVDGGPTRGGSVRAALDVIPADVPVVVCHDAARPFASPGLFDAVVRGLEERPEVAGVVPVVPVADTVKRVSDGYVIRTEPRDGLALAQTPQAFRATALREGHARAAAEGRDFSDDAALVEWAGHGIGTVPGEPTNFKITTTEDLAHAEALVAERTRG